MRRGSTRWAERQKQKAKQRADKEARIRAGNERWAAVSDQRQANKMAGLAKHRHHVTHCGNVGCARCFPLLHASTPRAR
jgi:hypothetical protein